ncbi:MAG TPA: hypothetical protein VH089_14870 [Streptosporangiaceae bacterium]|nr:hypothetical protein [Streptosporangiaceae bacterium]
MDEMTLLRELRSEIPATAVTPEAEAAFTARIRTETAAGPAARRAGRRRRLSRWGGRRYWRFAVAAAMSVALAVGLLVGLGGAAPTGPVATGTPSPTGTPSSSTRPVSAILLAEMAAAAATARPVVPASQWVYTKTVEKTTTPPSSVYDCRVKNAQGGTRNLPIPVFGGQISLRAGTPCSRWSDGHLQAGGYRVSAPAGPGKSSGVTKNATVTARGTVVVTKLPTTTHRQTSEQWTTADGTRQASYSNGKLVVSASCPCGMVGYAGLGKLPSDPKALAKWAMRKPGGGGHYTTADLAWNAFGGISGTLTSYVVPPKVAAELYRALADIPGVTVDQHAVDAAGRVGPAFVLTDHDYPGGGWTTELFLNPRTYQLTGTAERFPAQCQCPSPGTGSTAIVRQALVSGPGVRP